MWPDDAAVALDVGTGLAAASLMQRPDEPFLAMLADDARRRCAIEALAAWRDSARIVATRPALTAAHSGASSRSLAGAVD